MGRHCEPKPNEMNPFAVKSTTVTATTLKWKSFYFNLLLPTLHQATFFLLSASFSQPICRRRCVYEGGSFSAQVHLELPLKPRREIAVSAMAMPVSIH